MGGGKLEFEKKTGVRVWKETGVRICKAGKVTFNFCTYFVLEGVISESILSVSSTCASVAADRVVLCLLLGYCWGS